MTPTSTTLREREEVREVQQTPEPTLPELLARLEELRPLAAEFQRVRRQVRAAFEHRGLAVGARYIVGDYSVEPKAISGGGFEVARWDSVTYAIQHAE